MRSDLNLYTLKERIFLVKTFYKNDNDINCVKENYIYEYGEVEDVPADSLIYDVVHLFEETGSVREIPSLRIKKEEESSVAFVGCDTILTEIKTEQIDVEESNKDVAMSEEFAEFSHFLLDTTEHREEKKTPKKRTKPTKRKTRATNLKKQSDDETKFICAICERRCNTKYGLKLHISRHTKKPPKICKFCNISIPTRYKLGNHMKEKHADELTKKKPSLTCTVCSKTFKEAGNLRKHMHKHSDKMAEVCEVCGKAFKWRNALYKHKSVHTGERPFKCDYQNCDRTFRLRNSYDVHKRSHTNERPYICKDCGKGFKDKTSLNIHQRQHTGENPFKCELCGKETKQRQNLKSHMRHFHKMNT